MDLYISALRRWGRNVFKEPHSVMFISLIFTLFSLPVVTVGIAAVVCTYMSKLNIEGRQYKLKDVIFTRIKPIFWKAFLMGIFDIVLFIISVLCVFTLFGKTASIGWKTVYSFYLSVDIISLMSAMYRYPMLVCNDDLGIKELFVRGILLTFRNLFVCLLWTMVILTILIVSVLTGVGIVLIFPGAVSLLYICIYKQSLKAEGITDTSTAEI